MKNTYNLIWSNEAISNLKSIADYLEEKWTSKELTNFAKFLDKRLNLIKLSPHLFPASEKSKNIRRSVLSKQTTIYYRILNSSEVEIVSLFDNRQNPNRIRF